MADKQLTGYPSIDKPWLKYYSEEAINTPLPEGSMYSFVASRQDLFFNIYQEKFTTRTA